MESEGSTGDGSRSASRTRWGRRRSPLRKYQDLVVGSRSLGRLRPLRAGDARRAPGCPGPSACVLRKLLYPLAPRRRGPRRRLRAGRGAAPPAQGPPRRRRRPSTTSWCSTPRATSNRGIDVGRGVFLGRGTILSCKDGDIALGDHANLGFHCEVFSGSSVDGGAARRSSRPTSYLVGGGHEFERGGRGGDRPAAHLAGHRRSATTCGSARGPRCSTGCASAADVVVGANAVVTADLPDGAIAAGVPARVLRLRERRRRRRAVGLGSSR